MTTDYNQIKTNLERVQETIHAAAKKAGRSDGEVRLLVVTKAQPVEKLQAAYDAGARLFGENYPEETQQKIVALKTLSGIQWHMIGHLQSRKAKIVARSFDMLHSLDSVSLAEKLNRALEEFGRTLPVLIEVNVSGEESKTGFSASSETEWEQLLPNVQQILSLERLQVQGLMTMPPLFDNPEDVRPFFQKARNLRDYLAGYFPQTSWSELSMGTSSDYPIAIEEGATFVRVGTAIMGPRPPKRE